MTQHLEHYSRIGATVSKDTTMILKTLHAKDATVPVALAQHLQVAVHVMQRGSDKLELALTVTVWLNISMME